MPYDQTIALDAMGGDFGPSVVVPGAAMALKELGAGVRFIFFGDEKKITPFLERHKDLAAVSTIRHTDKIIASDEKPSIALRNGKDSSMRLAIEAVKNGEAGSIVSAGNTGALMATAKLIFRCLPGIDRPAIASVLPTQSKDTVVLDLGANIQCDAQALVQFAFMGAVYAREVQGLSEPLLGLLNVGSEAMKGPDHVREAAALLAGIKLPAKFIGFVEGDDITKGTVDVVVTDGFTGNIALKVAEGVGKLSSYYLKTALKSTPLAMLGAILAKKALMTVKQRMDPRYYNGGMFLGLDGICVKSHGGMDEYGFSRAVLKAATLVHNGYNARVAAELSRLMPQPVATPAAAVTGS